MPSFEQFMCFLSLHFDLVLFLSFFCEEIFIDFGHCILFSRKAHLIQQNYGDFSLHFIVSVHLDAVEIDNLKSVIWK